MDSEPEVTKNEGKYLTFIYRKQNEESARVRTTGLAKTFKVRPATVTEMLQKLAKRGLLNYTSYRGIELTEEGIAIAQRLLRKHRLLEVLLVQTLNYNIKNACYEASKLDHYASESFINEICQRYKHPRICPCNKTITHVRECGE